MPTKKAIRHELQLLRERALKQAREARNALADAEREVKAIDQLLAKES